MIAKKRTSEKTRPGPPSTPLGPGSNRWRPSAASVIFLAIVFAAGVFHWVLFFNYGNMTFKAHDWAKEYVYYSVIREAIESGSIPYHTSLAFQETKRFLALPETNLAPQVLLLPMMDTGKFVLADILILYAIGFAGCLLIRQRYNLSPIAFTVLFMLFNFNGHITAHLGVGHSMWAAYFLLPLFFLFVMEIVEGRASKTTPIKIGLVLFAITLRGGFHIFVWCLTFLILLLVFNWKYLKPVLWTVVYSVSLSAFRLIPAASTLVGKRERFIWSYPTVRDLLDALVTIREQTPDRLRPWGSAGWWEFDVYIGLLGLLLLLYFGVILRFSGRPVLEKHKYKTLDLPLLTISVFSVSYFHAFLTRLPLPLLKSERVATRFIIIPLVFLAFIAAIRMARVLETLKKSVKIYIASIAGLALMALSFVDHSYLWSVVTLEQTNRSRTVNLAAPDIVMMQDGNYRTLVILSWVISFGALVALIYLGLRWRRRAAR